MFMVVRLIVGPEWALLFLRCFIYIGLAASAVPISGIGVSRETDERQRRYRYGAKHLFVRTRLRSSPRVNDKFTDAVIGEGGAGSTSGISLLGSLDRRWNWHSYPASVRSIHRAFDASCIPRGSTRWPTLYAQQHVTSPVFLNARKTTDKAISMIQQAASHKANIVVFPETYISAFPLWSALRPPTENHGLFDRMVQESVHADGEEIAGLREAARATGTVVSIGFSEKSRHSNACLYNSNLLIGTEGEILVHHRKLVPTFFEKLTWSPGDGYGLRVVDTPFGRIGGLICGENTNPLARYALMAQAEQMHISTWPAIWPTRTPHLKHRDDQKASDLVGVQGMNYDNLAANRTRVAAHCFEAKCFGVACAAKLGEDAIDVVVGGASQPDIVSTTLRAMPQAATFFLGPTGASFPGFTFTDKREKEMVEILQDNEGILYADMNFDDCVEGKQYHGVVGGYQRPNVSDLKVDRSRHSPVDFKGQTEEE